MTQLLYQKRKLKDFGIVLSSIELNVTPALSSKSGKRAKRCYYVAIFLALMFPVVLNIHNT